MPVPVLDPLQVENALLLKQRATPATPASGYIDHYANTDGRARVKDDDGNIWHAGIFVGAAEPTNPVDGDIWIDTDGDATDAFLTAVYEWAPFYKFKTVDEIVTNTTTVQNDDDLFIPVDANKVYEIEVIALGSGNVAQDIKFEMTLPSGATGQKLWHGTHTDASLNPANGSLKTVSGTSFGGSGEGFGAAGGDCIYRLLTIVTVGATAGNVQLQWAQLAAAANNTTLRAGSYIRRQRIRTA